MAAGAGRKQSEPDWHASLHWTVVPACAGAGQQPDTGNTTTGRNKVELKEWKVTRIDGGKE